MCGVCGVVDFGSHSELGDQRAAVERMVQSIRHRGPDDQGVHVAGPAVLGHVRLSIIDLSSAGHQPMVSDDGQVVMSYNGEVYNFQSLRAELEAKGRRFRSASDSEVVLQGYQEWGEGVFEKLNGMFAVALWDARAQCLLLARDRFGIKPLMFWHEGKRLVFGSEIKALLAHGGIDRRMSWPFLHEYLYFGASLLEDTAFEGIYKVLPGTFVRFDASGRSEHRYYDLRNLPVPEGGLEELTEGVRERLDAAMRRHLIADVPVAVFLSGGIDSSAVATLCAPHGDGPLRTYTAGFDQGADMDERPRARRLAERLGTDHRELFVRVGDVMETLETLVRHHDEPFGDAANLPIYLLCGALAEDGVKVVLQGDGGDEIFAGYRRYNVLAHEKAWRSVAPAALRAFGMLPESPLAQRGLRFLRAMAAPDPTVRLALLLTIEDAARPPTRLLSGAAQQRLATHDPFRSYRRVLGPMADRDAVDRMLATDCLLLLPDVFLTKVDRPSMAHSIEVRVPFLDAELTDYAVPIPSKFKVRRGQKKVLLRRALRGVVPDEILDGKKHGLEVPYNRWLRTDLREPMRQRLLDAPGALGELFDRGALERCIDDHAAGLRDDGYLLYKLLQLAMWHEEYRPAL